MSRPILLIGDRGMLGRAFRALFARTRRPYTGFDLPGFDASKPEQVVSLLRKPWSAVINCAAFTHVDNAQFDEKSATRGNATVPHLLAEVCARTRIPLVHFGTDYVFSGNAAAPYPVDAPMEPLGVYGRTKAAGEEAIRSSGAKHLIIRTSWLYAPWGNNFVRTMAKLTSEKPSLKVVNDQRGRPTSADHLAATTLALFDRGETGTFHVTDGGECTWYEFTLEIVSILGRSVKVEPCTTAEFPRPAPRPAYSVLDISKTEAVLGPMPDWRTNLKSVIDRLEPVS